MSEQTPKERWPHTLETDPKVEGADNLAVLLADCVEAIKQLSQNSEIGEIFNGTMLVPSELAENLKYYAEEARGALRKAITDLTSPEATAGNTSVDDQKMVNEVLTSFFNQLLRGSSGTNLTHMLRLWQAMEWYCSPQNANNEAGLDKIYASREPYSRACEAFIRQASKLGVRFHSIHFGQTREQLDKQGILYRVQDGAPPIGYSERLTGGYKARERFEGGVADLALWGVECDFNDQMNSQSSVWFWRK